MPRWAAPVVAALVAALLASGVVAVSTVSDDDAPSTSTTTTPTSSGGTTTSTTTASTTIEDVIDELKAFVEEARGLTYKEPVDVTLLSDEEFEDRINEFEEEDLTDLRDTEAVLKALGLLDPGDDLEAIVRSFTADAVLGFYDTETKELVVKGAEPTPFVRTVLVHELTHALEDQHFGLDRDDLDDEASSGFDALVEGSANVIEDRYRDSLSRDEQRSADREEAAIGGNTPDIPPAVAAGLGFPYVYGPDLVDAIVDAGGRARLDRAFKDDPPTSTEQVLDPDKYLGDDQPKPVPTPAAGGVAIDDGQIGELFLILLLRTELSAGDAREAAGGWGGDAYVAWKEGGRTCVRMDFVMDTPADTNELTRAFADFADERGSDTQASGTSLRMCG